MTPLNNNFSCYYQTFIIIQYIQKPFQMINTKQESSETLSQAKKQKSEDLVIFDEQFDEDQEFYSEYSSQVYKDQGSIISDETQKRKQEARQKFNEYISYRKSLGYAVHKKNVYNDEEDIDGALIDQLGQIEGEYRFNTEIEQFILMFNKKPENAINQYIRRGIIQKDDPETIASYLISVEGLDKVVLGEYFGKNKPEVMKILYEYCRLLKFHNIEYDKAIRQLLGKFRLPGEAQQIQRIIYQFSKAFFDSNKQNYSNLDQLFPLAYAIIMLATDAHNPKQQKKMTKQDFIVNTQRPCPSISVKILSQIYDRMTKQKIQTQNSYLEQLYRRIRDIGTIDIQGMLKLTKDLMEGDVFLKVCRNTNKFVQRKIYLSEDQKRICWVNNPEKVIKDEPRFIEIKDITGLTLGLNSNVMKKNKVPRQFDSLCFTIETYNRTLDLKAKTNKERAKWVNYIRAILIQRRQQAKEEVQQLHSSTMSRQRIQEIWNTDIFPHWNRHWDYAKKKPKQKSVIVRGIQAICCCFKNQTAQNNFDLQGNVLGIKVRTSLLDSLWKLGLPQNSRKTLWPQVIGNNLVYTASMVEDLRKKLKKTDDFKELMSFDEDVIELGLIAREVRPDIPPIRGLLLMSSVFLKVFPKGSPLIINFINLIHLHHVLAFYRGDKTEIDLRLKLFEYILQKNCPKVKQHFEVLKLETRMYLVNWFLSIFTDCFYDNDDFCLRIWDNFLLEGELYLFKVGITIIKYYQVELTMCTFFQGLKLLRFPKQISQVLFFEILDTVDVKEEYYKEYVEQIKHAIIKTKVQAIPLE